MDLAAYRRGGCAIIPSLIHNLLKFDQGRLQPLFMQIINVKWELAEILHKPLLPTKEMKEL